MKNSVKKLPFREKYESRNPISRFLIHSFIRKLLGFVRKVNPASILEIGCGEGFLALAMAEAGYYVRALDVRKEALEFARQKILNLSLINKPVFEEGDIYKLLPSAYGEDMIVCCEVLEHLEHPEKAMKSLTALSARSAIFSVPQEPLWRALNMCRLKYLCDFGNTPGHINHWTKKRFLAFLGTYYTVQEFATPLPWTIALCKKHPAGSSC